jgi:hypothetical protein
MLCSQVAALQPFLADHGKAKEQWAPLVAKLNKLPQFAAGLQWEKARSKFHSMMAASTAKPATGADDEPHSELQQILEDIRELQTDAAARKATQADAVSAAQQHLIDDGKSIRDSAVEGLAKRQKTEKTSAVSVFETYLAEKSKLQADELALRKLELEERKRLREQEMEEKRLMFDFAQEIGR